MCMYFFSVFDKTIFTRITRQVPLARSRNCYPSRAREFTPSFSGIRVVQSLVFWVALCRSSFAHVSFFFWSLCCLSFDLQLLITPLVSSNLLQLYVNSIPKRLVIHFLRCIWRQNVIGIVKVYSIGVGEITSFL